MRAATFAFLLSVVAAGPALAQAPPPPAAALPDASAWVPAPPVLPKGFQIAIVSGDPSQPGRFTVLIKIPANAAVAAHTHPTDEAVTVISGAFFLGMGEKLDKTRGERVEPGRTVTAPANMAHYAYTGDEETIIQISAEGPFAITYVDPAEDPSKNPAASTRT
jgi:quercetin dioxygenase-like cupin family protein